VEFVLIVIIFLFVKKFPNTYTEVYLFQYEDQDEVVLWMNTVGPYHNRQETYAYFSLPFCMGTKESIGHYHETLSEALQGVELEFSGLDIEFKGR
jgi:transmembrane 9 superfamily protein 3